MRSRCTPLFSFVLISFVVAANCYSLLSRPHSERTLPLTTDIISGETPEGKTQRVVLTSARQIIILFSFDPSCGYCADSLPIWRIIAASASRDRYRFFGIVTGASSYAMREYVADGRVNFPLLLRVPEDQRKALMVDHYPATVVVDPTERVVHAWRGMPQRYLRRIREVTGVAILPFPFRLVQQYVFR